MVFLPLSLSLSFAASIHPAISREDPEDSNNHLQHNHHHHHLHRSGHGNNQSNKIPFNGYNSEEYLDRLEPNGNIPANKSDLGYGKRKLCFVCLRTDSLWVLCLHLHLLLIASCDFSRPAFLPPSALSIIPAHHYTHPMLCAIYVFYSRNEVVRRQKREETNFNEIALVRKCSKNWSKLLLFIVVR